MTSYDPVVALVRGLDVLRSLNERGPSTVGDLYHTTAIAKPTIVRMLETLVHAGYVDYLPDERRYQVTARVLLLSNGYELQHQLLKLASPILNHYRTEVGWPIELGVFDHDAMVILDTSREPDTFSVNRKTGSRLPVLSSALGRAYLSALTDEALSPILSTLLAQQPNGAEAIRMDEMIPLIKACRQRGYGYADRTLASNACAIAAAIRMNGKPIGSVNIASHVAAMPLASLEEKHGKTVQTMAEEISAALRVT
jgi:IclR family mhp operon transcriptional activator